MVEVRHHPMGFHGIAFWAPLADAAGNRGVVGGCLEANQTIRICEDEQSHSKKRMLRWHSQKITRKSGKLVGSRV